MTTSVLVERAAHRVPSAVQIALRDRIMGGIPRDPKVIEGWLRSKAGITADEELRVATVRTLRDLGVEVAEGATYEQMREASAELAATLKTNCFKRGADGGLYIESRIVKAMIKESVAILYPGGGANKWGPTKKAPRGLTAERVFISPDRIDLGVGEPSGVQLFVGHPSGPSGNKPNLTYYEYVEQPVIDFEVMVAEDEIKPEQCAMIWTHAEENGLGTLRSQGFGRFDVTRWERVTA